MSLVGPRPGLENQDTLTLERNSRGVFGVRPGITGLSQINKVDMSTPAQLAEMDAKMIETLSLQNYFKYLLQTLTGGGQGDRVR